MHDILLEFSVTATPEKVFEAFTSPTGLNAWWTLEAEGQPLQGSIYRFYFGPQYDWRAQVLQVDPHRSLTWQMTEAMDDWLPTRVGFQLTPSDQACTVQFFHKNWPHADRHFAISTYCWGQLLRGLKDYVESGTTIPFDQRN